MDYQTEQPQNTPPGKVIIIPNLFIIASIAFAILCWMCSCFILSSVFFGSLSIIFAVLSKGTNKKMIPAARTACVASVIAMIISAVTTVTSIVSVFSDPELYQEFKTQYEAMTGISIDEEFQQIENLYHINLRPVE